MRPPSFDSRGHPLPRRASPDKSITLHNHRLARDASSRLTSSSALGVTGPQTQPQTQPTSSPTRRNSSGESNDTGHSDPKNWFDQSNRNPVAAFNDESNNMEVDPPFYQKETDSSNEDSRYPPGRNPSYPPRDTQMQGLRAAVAHSSSADDFRSVIDDLTVENKRLKEELKRYKQFGSDMMRKEKLFEIKVHGLPRRKKRELEATLREFAASLGGSSESTSQRRKGGRHGKAVHSSGVSLSKHDSSSSSRSRPVDSAYASMSTGPSSHAAHSSAHPVHTEYGCSTRVGRNHHGTARPPPEGLREARIQLQEGENPEKIRSSKGTTSASNSGGDQTELGGTVTAGGDGSGSGGRTVNNTSPPGVIAPDQRPTRPRDLDPDRVQIPSENMDYIRHLGLVSPEFLQGSRTSYQDVAPDAEGWVYLNLLCNLAQLHMINVTPSFIRQAVSEKSTKFQLSSDGRKIRWRGGTDGTKFSSDSSEDKSQKSPLTDDTEDGSDKTSRRKKQKTQPTRSELGRLGLSRSPSDTFHYKPMFVHRHASSAETSLEESASQGSDVVDESNLANSKWDFSGSGTTQQRSKRRYDGAIVYYTGAQFCTDLSGEPGDMSPTAQMTATGREQEASGSGDDAGRVLQRTLSGSSLPVRPLSDDRARVAEALDFDPQNPLDLVSDDGFSPNDEDFAFPWCEDPAKTQVQPLAKEVMEPSGLGGVLPDDHFAIFVTTRRVMRPTLQRHLSRSTTSEDTAEIIAERLASIRTSSPLPPPRSRSLVVAPLQIEYVSREFHRLNPASLPPPAMFYPPFSTDSSWDDGDELVSDEEEVEEMEEESFSEGQISHRANPHFSDNNTYMRKDDLAFDTETDVRMDSSDDHRMSSDSGLVMRSVMPRPAAVDGDGSPLVTVTGRDVDMLHTGSSVATAGGAESGYSSSMEDVSSS
ncbi:putative frequency, clock protein FRQ [Sordaria macrospora k-hell]|uniref:Putative frequency, clock protein FRQ n=1 Tax=Sordaria macrospora (strain ATCC MYA-333 / DSM 997 / K(L3346) / K-hell) TaxID=771870 RepID=F7VVY1_SORMK|nr:putative frequency, clock protein FRQ [Sordaria macrospora k-hell]CCC09672.1 putative frequency, clock protein FRQ [Sordaria macrospora k-hell]